jgi:hypothetical protein
VPELVKGGGAMPECRVPRSEFLGTTAEHHVDKHMLVMVGAADVLFIIAF